MGKLLKDKYEAVVSLNNFTKEIMKLPLKVEYTKINAMIGERQEYIEKIRDIDIKINEYIMNNGKFKESEEVKNLKIKIKILVAETIEMDKEIRKNVNDELKSVKASLNQPQSFSKLVNIKA
ncbi:MAG: hypothetical protein SA378_07845 [Sedimentibacter sp.]|uniref:hypothetical protein n=1 Tax=Sedimentibacter sp. TaxID=1960295 RepID=UPI002980A5BD|nr:hypothetical protein [Sedimentibacter sp.]MDW5300034.1 hypothetical protein [Sedimentibacter sp.]